MVAYPIALLAGLSLRALPYLFYTLLLATQIMFLFALARLTGGLAQGASGLLFWFLVPPLMAAIFSWRVNLIGNLLLLAFPNLLALSGAFAGFDPVKFNLLAVPIAAIALFISHFTDNLLRRIHELQKQMAWRTAAMQSAGEAMHVTDRNGVIEYVNPAFCASTGYPPEEAIGKKPSLLKSGFQDNAFYENLWTTILKGEIWRGEIINRCKDDSSITLSMTISPVLDCDGHAERFIAISHDITARKRLEEEVALGHAELEAIFNNAGGGIALLDLWGRFIKVNDFWLGILGYSPEEATALSYKDISHDDDVAETQQLFVALASGEIPHYENDRRFVRSGGRVFWGHLSMTPVKDEAGYIRAIIAIVQDINERKLLEDKLESMAHYDALTGLPNRALFFDRLSQAIAQTRRSQGQFALMFVDLDGFKAVNDTFGHDTGDALLKAVAEHLLECVRESDTVARMGGDEFTIILRAIRGAQDASSVAEKILTTLAAPYHLLGHECRIGASLGIVLYPQHGNNAEELLNQADHAMYAVKKAGKNAYRFAESQERATGESSK
jgi:diguanylate cyclase (GGDEF)-like protein/PAS domain S-box-containing protein